MSPLKDAIHHLLHPSQRGQGDHPQPSQKRFESLVYDRLTVFDASRPVYVEAESARIGRVSLPLALRTRMRESPVTEIVSPLSSRVDYLHRDYESWLAEPDRVIATIDRLKSFHSGETIERWKGWCVEGQWRGVIGGLLEEHYDRRYGTDEKGRYRKPERQGELADQTEANIRECSRVVLEAEEGEKQVVG